MESDESLWIVLQIGFVLLLVALNGFFVAAEFALVKIRDSQIKPLIRKGNRKAVMTQKVLDHLDASLSACQLGITLARLALGWVGEPVFAALLEPVMEAFCIESVRLQHSLSFYLVFRSLHSCISPLENRLPSCWPFRTHYPPRFGLPSRFGGSVKPLTPSFGH